MHETEADIAALRRLVEDSCNAAGAHLLAIHTPERRLGAVQLVGVLLGMCLLALATVSSDGRPFVGAVDGVFYRGAFHFGSAADSLRLRHIRSRPQVSAIHLPGEQLAVTVHGRAAPLDVRAPQNAGFREALLEVYVPRYGAQWEEFLDSGLLYARIEAERMFAFSSPS